MAALPTIIPVEVATFINSRYQHLKTRYQPPQNLKEIGLFWQGIKKTDNFKQAVKNRVQYGACIGIFDVSIRYATYYSLVGGYWSGYGGVNVEFWKKIFPTM